MNTVMGLINLHEDGSFIRELAIGVRLNPFPLPGGIG